MIKQFEQVQVTTPNYNAFDLSHDVLASGNPGLLYPVLVHPTIPGDKFRINAEVFTRVSPLAVPAMSKFNVFLHFFYVPNRIIWKYWNEFCDGGRDGSNTVSIPYMLYSDAKKNGTTYDHTFQKRRVSDYMGVQPNNHADNTQSTNNNRINFLPIMAYQKIFYDWFMDENLSYLDPNNQTLDYAHPLEDVGDLSLSSLADSYRYFNHVRPRFLEKDYFTSALPFAQRSALGSAIPVSGDISLNPNNTASSVLSHSPRFGTYSGGSFTPAPSGTTGSNITQGSVAGNVQINGGNASDLVYDPNGTLTLSGVNITIEDIRRANSLQRFLERDMVAGYRSIETIYAHFGIVSSDARLQRSEYLGGSRSALQISEVAQTDPTTGSVAGTLVGRAVSYDSAGVDEFYCEEHGYIIGIMSVLPRTMYGTGIPRMFNVNDRFDIYWPEFANLGEQKVLKKELFIHSDYSADDYNTFGYQSKYVEYKQIPSHVVGDMRDVFVNWHSAIMFDQTPYLNQSFVTGFKARFLDIFANQSSNDHHFLFNIHFDIKALRLMPEFSNPSL